MLIHVHCAAVIGLTIQAYFLSLIAVLLLLLVVSDFHIYQGTYVRDYASKNMIYHVNLCRSVEDVIIKEGSYIDLY